MAETPGTGTHAGFALYLLETAGPQPCADLGALAEGLRAGARGLVVFEAPDPALARTLAAGGTADPGAWEAAAETVLGIVRQHRRRLVLAERPEDRAAAEALEQSLIRAVPALGAVDLAPALAPAPPVEPVLMAAAGLAVAQLGPLQRLLAELRATSPAGAAADPVPAAEQLRRIGAAWPGQQTATRAELDELREAGARAARARAAAEETRDLLLGQLGDVEASLVRSSAEAATLRERTGALSAALETETARAAAAETAATEAAAARDRAEAQHRQQAHRLGELEAELARETERATAAARAEAEALCGTLSRQVREIEAELRRAEAEARTARAREEALETGLRHDNLALHYQVEQLYSSTSWRLTAPFRRLTALFRKTPDDIQH